MRAKFKLAIHHRPGSFSDRWINYCNKNNIYYEIVDCYSSNIIDKLKDFDGLMWHWAHYDYRAQLFARQLTYSLKLMGVKVFPDINTCWHFDDKLGQKYLLEAISAPLVPSYVFFDKKQALEWAKTTTFPKVFKLRGGAGASNVCLIKNKKMANRMINRAFSCGFYKFSSSSIFFDRITLFRRQPNVVNFFKLLKGFSLLFRPIEYEIMAGKDKGYIYYQDFIPDNTFDIRIIVIGDRAFGIKRLVRKNDFRASGSGMIIYDKDAIPVDCVKIAFETTQKLKAQCLGYDFVFYEATPYIIEISYGFTQEGYDECAGYWDKNLIWHSGQFTAQDFMVEDFISNEKSYILS